MIGILGLWFRLTDPAATENYTYIPTVSLHEALPISRIGIDALVRPADHAGGRNARHRRPQHEHRVDRRHRKIAVVGYDQPRGLRRFHRADEIDDFLRKVGPVDIGPIPGVVGEIGGADADPLVGGELVAALELDRKSTRLNSSH